MKMKFMFFFSFRKASLGSTTLTSTISYICMPNWCENSLTVIGEDIDIINFLNVGFKSANRERIRRLENKLINSAGLTLRSWLPLPEVFKYDTTNHPYGEGLKVGERLDGVGPIIDEALIDKYKKATEEQLRDYKVVGWCDYNCKTLGTKWDVRIDEIYLEPGNNTWSLYMHFTTAWSPAIEWLQNIYKDYPSLKFYLDYEEPGMGFAGIVEAYAEENIFINKDKEISDCDESD